MKSLWVLIIFINLDEIISNILSFDKLYSVYSEYEDLVGCDDYFININPDWVKNGQINCLWKGEPSYTTYQLYKGTLDYIFIADNDYNDLFVDCLLKLCDKVELKEGIPNEKHGSDHLMLFVVFKMLF